MRATAAARVLGGDELAQRADHGRRRDVLAARPPTPARRQVHIAAIPGTSASAQDRRSRGCILHHSRRRRGAPRAAGSRPHQKRPAAARRARRATRGTTSPTSSARPAPRGRAAARSARGANLKTKTSASTSSRLVAVPCVRRRPRRASRATASVARRALALAARRRRRRRRVHTTLPRALERQAA